MSHESSLSVPEMARRPPPRGDSRKVSPRQEYDLASVSLQETTPARRHRAARRGKVVTAIRSRRRFPTKAARRGITHGPRSGTPHLSVSPAYRAEGEMRHRDP